MERDKFLQKITELGEVCRAARDATTSSAMRAKLNIAYVRLLDLYDAIDLYYGEGDDVTKGRT